MPLLLGALAIGCSSLYSSGEDRRKATALACAIDPNATREDMINGAEIAKVITRKDAEILRTEEAEKIGKQSKSPSDVGSTSNITKEVGEKSVEIMEEVGQPEPKMVKEAASASKGLRVDTNTTTLE
jgi:hypothetical protein